MNDIAHVLERKSWVDMYSGFEEERRRQMDVYRPFRQLMDAMVVDRPAEPEKPKVKLKTPKPKRNTARDDTVEYEALCAELGYAPTAIEGNRVRRIFKSKRIPVYDKGEVSAYMTSITPSGMHWGWMPLCHKSTGSKHLSRDGAVIGGQYDKLVPIHILKRIKAVKELFVGEEPKFYVTDYAVPDPDPFVKVILKCGEDVIFGVWDEPGFGDLKTEV